MCNDGSQVSGSASNLTVFISCFYLGISRAMPYIHEWGQKKTKKKKKKKKKKKGTSRVIAIIPPVLNH